MIGVSNEVEDDADHVLRHRSTDTTCTECLTPEKEQWVRFMPTFLVLLLNAAIADTPRKAGDFVQGPFGYPLHAVPAGIYEVGCTPGQGPDCSAGPVRRVETVPLLVGEVEVTRGLYRKIAGGAPEAWDCKQDDCPVEMVTWRDVVEFANAMSRHEGLRPCYVITKNEVFWRDGGALCEGYRLPSADEWEVAARGGQDFKFSGSDSIDSVGWYSENSGDRLHVVATKMPNAYGLHDMTGNVAEIVWPPSGKIAAASTGTVIRDPLCVSPLCPVAESWSIETKRYAFVGFRLVRTDLESRAAAERQAKEAEALARDAFLAEPTQTAETTATDTTFDTAWTVVIYCGYTMVLGFLVGVGIAQRSKDTEGLADLIVIVVTSVLAPFWVPLWAGYKLLLSKEYFFNAKGLDGVVIQWDEASSRSDKVYLVRTDTGFSVVEIKHTGQNITNTPQVTNIRKHIARHVLDYLREHGELND